MVRVRVRVEEERVRGDVCFCCGVGERIGGEYAGGEGGEEADGEGAGREEVER